MKSLALFGATIAAVVTFSHIANADYVSRIACLPTANVSEEPYWIDCESHPNATCTCDEGFTAFNPSIDDDTTGSVTQPQPVSASPG